MNRWRIVAVVIIVAVLVGAAVFDPAPRKPATATGSVGVLPAAVTDPEARRDAWFCAGGSATDGGLADVRLAFLNTTPGERVATVTAAGSRRPDGQRATASRQLTIGGYARAELRLAELVPGSPYAGATVELSGGGVIVEQAISGALGADRAPCAPAAASDWYLPISATATDKNPTARAVLVLYNPYADAAVLDVDFSAGLTSSAPPIESMVVPARSVETVDLTATVPVAPQLAVAIHARAGRVVADRIEAFDDGARRDLVLTPAVATPEPTWFFPSGRLGAGRQERLAVYNPGDDRASVAVEVRPDDRSKTVEPFDLEVGSHQAVTLDLHAEKRLTDAGVTGYSVVVKGDRPIVVERMVTVAPGNPGAGASSTTASAYASPSIVVDSVAPGDGAGSELVVFNPNAHAIARVQFEVIAGGSRRPAGPDGVELQPGQRYAVPFAQLGPGPLTAVVTATAAVIAEREIVVNATRAASMGVPARDTLVMPSAVTLDLGG